MKTPASLRLLGFLFGILTLAIAAQTQAAAGDDAPPALKASVDTLQQRGFIKEADAAYWLENARGKKSCDGAKVGDLIIACVSAKKKVGNIAEACAYLKETRTIQATDYWQANAVAGKTCVGDRVASLFSRLAKMPK